MRGGDRPCETFALTSDGSAPCNAPCLACVLAFVGPMPWRTVNCADKNTADHALRVLPTSVAAALPHHRPGKPWMGFLSAFVLVVGAFHAATMAVVLVHNALRIHAANHEQHLKVREHLLRVCGKTGIYRGLKGTDGEMRDLQAYMELLAKQVWPASSPKRGCAPLMAGRVHCRRDLPVPFGSRIWVCLIVDHDACACAACCCKCNGVECTHFTLACCQQRTCI